jgi:phosphoenolpyruvate carboxylase
MALSLEIPEVLSVLRKAFPHGAKQLDEQSAPSFDEQATYRPRGIDDYARLETEILTPMEIAYEFVREIGTGISHHFGAFG